MALFLVTRQRTEAENDSRIEVIKYLIDELKADVTRRDNNNNTVLFPAANNCPGKVVKLIIEQYVENFGRNKLKNFIDYKNKAEIDALDIALNSGNEKAIEVLISYEADIENKINGESRLLHAVKEGDIKKTELLLKQGENVNTKDEKGLTSLDLAMQKSNQSMTQFLKEMVQNKFRDKSAISSINYAGCYDPRFSTSSIFYYGRHSRNCCKKTMRHFQ